MFSHLARNIGDMHLWDQALMVAVPKALHLRFFRDLIDLFQ